MGNREYYEKKLEVISTIKDSQIKKLEISPGTFFFNAGARSQIVKINDRRVLVTFGEFLRILSL